MYLYLRNFAAAFRFLFLKIWHCFFPENGTRVPKHVEEVHLMFVLIKNGDRGGTVFKVLCYKSEGRWFDPRWCHWNFSLTLNPSDRTLALGSTQPLTEMSTGSIS